MWLMTTTGFYSIVHYPDTGMVIRARAGEDLDRLRELMPELSPTQHTPHQDYHWRAVAPREAIAKWLASEVLERIDYPNFKNAVKAGPCGPDRAMRYNQVWGALLPIQDAERIRRHYETLRPLPMELDPELEDYEEIMGSEPPLVADYDSRHPFLPPWSL